MYKDSQKEDIKKAGPSQLRHIISGLFDNEISTEFSVSSGIVMDALEVGLSEVYKAGRVGGGYLSEGAHSVKRRFSFAKSNILGIAHSDFSKKALSNSFATATYLGKSIFDKGLDFTNEGAKSILNGAVKLVVAGGISTMVVGGVVGYKDTFDPREDGQSHGGFYGKSIIKGTKATFSGLIEELSDDDGHRARFIQPAQHSPVGQRQSSVDNIPQ